MKHFFFAPILPSDPFQIDSEDHVTFALVPATPANEISLDNVAGYSIDDYNKTVLKLAKQQTVLLNQLTCVDHPYGFTVSTVHPDDLHELTGVNDIEDDSDSDGEYLVDGDDGNEFVHIGSHARHTLLFKKVHEKPVADHDTGPGVVTYKGIDWQYESRLNYNTVVALRKLYGNKKKGFGDRDASKVRGDWGYFGPRRTAQASNTNEYPNSKGHDLHQRTNDDLIAAAMTRITNSLSKESENAMETAGDTMTRLMLDFCDRMPVGTAIMKVCLRSAIASFCIFNNMYC